MAPLTIVFILASFFHTAISNPLRSEVDLRFTIDCNPSKNEKMSDLKQEISNEQVSSKPSNCLEIFLNGNKNSGIYTIYPESWFKAEPFDVYCDMDTFGGGWTVFQRRDDIIPRESFFRGWDDYKRGFGNLSAEFWLGNEKIHLLTNQDQMILRVDLEDFNGERRFALYNKFQVSNIIMNYSVEVGYFSGDAGDSITYHDGSAFATYDYNDVKECVKKYKGGWWYKNCHHANLNGLYLKGNPKAKDEGVSWNHWKGNDYSLKRTELKIRPKNFLQFV